MALLYRITKSKDSASELIFLNGKINEDAGGPLNDLLEKIGHECLINLKEINEVNHLGVRLWINFMRKFEASRKVSLEECPPEVINQINMIPNFKGKGEILSLYARYVCEHCGNKQLKLFKTGENMPRSLDVVHRLPIIHCTNCRKTMEMEELAEEFFACMITP